MTLLLLSAALAQDLASWTKPEAETLALLEPPQITCCGFDRTLWRRAFEPVRADVRACAPSDLDTRLRLGVTLTFPADTDHVQVEIDTNDPELEACLTAALAKVRLPDGPLGCTFRVTWPVIYAPPDAQSEAG